MEDDHTCNRQDQRRCLMSGDWRYLHQTLVKGHSVGHYCRTVWCSVWCLTTYAPATVEGDQGCLVSGVWCLKSGVWPSMHQGTETLVSGYIQWCGIAAAEVCIETALKTDSIASIALQQYIASPVLHQYTVSIPLHQYNVSLALQQYTVSVSLQSFSIIYLSTSWWTYF